MVEPRSSCEDPEDESMLFRLNLFGEARNQRLIDQIKAAADLSVNRGFFIIRLIN